MPEITRKPPDFLPRFPVLRTNVNAGRDGPLSALPGLNLLRMDRFALGQHGHECRNPCSAGFRLFRGMDPVENGIAVRPVELLEKATGFPVYCQCRAKIVGHLSRALRRIGGVPAS